MVRIDWFWILALLLLSSEALDKSLQLRALVSCWETIIHGSLSFLCILQGRETAYLCSRLSFQGCLHGNHLGSQSLPLEWRAACLLSRIAMITSPSEEKNRFAAAHYKRGGFLSLGSLSCNTCTSPRNMKSVQPALPWVITSYFWPKSLMLCRLQGKLLVSK